MRAIRVASPKAWAFHGRKHRSQACVRDVVRVWPMATPMKVAHGEEAEELDAVLARQVRVQPCDYLHRRDLRGRVDAAHHLTRHRESVQGLQESFRALRRGRS